MLTIIMLAVFTVLLAHGIHAVTREGMLLQSLGVYIKGERQVKDDRKELAEAKAKNKEALILQLEEMSDGIVSQGRLAGLLSEFEEAEQTAQELLSPIKFSRNYEAERSKLHWRILLPFAPMLTECLVCMSSFWSVIVLLLHFFELSVAGIPVLYFLLPFCVAGANFMLNKKRNYAEIVEAIKDL